MEIAKASGGAWALRPRLAGPVQDGAAATPSTEAALRRWAGLALIVAALALLTACSLPRTAAMPGEVLRGTGGEDSEFQVVAVTRASLPEITSWPPAAPEGRHHWVGTGASAVARLVRAGDRITLSIWDSQRDSLITPDEQRVVNMEQIEVSPAGEIFIPYIGDFRISGMTTDRARRDIQQLMERIVPDAQVQLAVEPGSRNTIDLVSGVARPGRYGLGEISPTIMSVLAEAGGIIPDQRNPLVRLQRSGQSYTIPAVELLANPAHDIQLRGGDRIVVEPDRRSYIALGAAGTQQVVYFERERISALDALSTVGGLSESRADLRGVMVLREYPESLLRPGEGAPNKPLVIFTFDMSNADGLFAAQRFYIQPNDVVLATESPAPMMNQIFGMVRLFRNLPS
ncbi:MAG: polysaccharide export protein [Pararhodobacter sp.]|nr:polysaccharide export protein [Pararhodobacter sp.]